MTKKRFLMMAGGTGGHIFPALAVADVLRQQGHDVVWLGSKHGMEETLVPQHHIPLETIAIKGIRGNGLWRKLTLPWTLSRSIFASMRIIRHHRIDAVIGFGGFVSFPGAIAAWLLRKPIVIHEQNAVAGLANRTIAKIADKILFAFPSAFPKQTQGLVGNPVRASISQLAPPKVRFASHVGALRLLVIGGSLGARIFNEVLPQVVANLPACHRPLIIHQCGQGQSKAVHSAYLQCGSTPIDCREFIDDMPQVYAWADFVICRAGALTCAELAAVGLGGILVPYPLAVDNHQHKNAAYLAENNAVTLLDQQDFNVENLTKFIKNLSREQCQSMAENARNLAVTDAAEAIAKAAIEVTIQD